jgi:diguanylate cyclase (GGDEF)-like protein
VREQLHLKVDSTAETVPAHPAGADGMNVLIADDDPVCRTLLQRLLESWGHSCVVAVDGSDAWRKLSAPQAPTLAIVDWEMPGLDGVELVAKVRTFSIRSTYPYILLLTSRTSAEDVYQGLLQGADDYLTKPFNARELRARLHVGTRILRLQQDLANVYAEAKFQASHDSLTGLLNRRMLLELAQQELSRSSRDGRFPVAILGDIDSFKAINDTYGHLAGDVVLAELAARAGKAVRAYDLLGRYGGEEFLIIAPDCNPSQGMSLAERVRDRIACKPIQVGEHSLNVTISLGVACAGPGMDLSRLLLSADSAMYAAKRAGRNRVELARS